MLVACIAGWPIGVLMKTPNETVPLIESLLEWLVLGFGWTESFGGVQVVTSMVCLFVVQEQKLPVLILGVSVLKRLLLLIPGMVRLRNVGLSRAYRKNLTDAGLQLLRRVSARGHVVSKDTPPQKLDAWLEEAVEEAHAEGERLYWVTIGELQVVGTIAAGYVASCKGLEVFATCSFPGSYFGFLLGGLRGRLDSCWLEGGRLVEDAAVERGSGFVAGL